MSTLPGMRLVAVAVAVAVTLALALLLSGCGGSEEPAGDAGSPASAGMPADGGLSVAEALRTESDEPLLVRGSLVARGSEARLCSALAESHPPQCGKPSLRVEGLDLDSVTGLEEAGGVRWTERELALLGHVADGVLEIAETSM